MKISSLAPKVVKMTTSAENFLTSQNDNISVSVTDRNVMVPKFMGSYLVCGDNWAKSFFWK